MKRTLVVLLIVLAPMLSMGQTLYWIGGSGNWNDPSNWATIPGGPSIGFVPNGETDVVFPGHNESRSILLDEANCKSLSIETGQASTKLMGYTLQSFGHIELGDSSAIELHEWKIKGTSCSFNPGTSSINTPLVVDLTGQLQLQNHLSLSKNGALTIKQGEFNTGNFGISTPELKVLEQGQLNLGSSRLNIFREISITQFPENHETESASLYLSGQVESVEIGEIDFSRIVQASVSTTCGTNPGQTPFTIEAVVVTNFNGEDISCNGANDGSATVNVSGGVGPFVFQWIGGDAPGFSQNYNNLGAGTYTVLVTDQGQGITCVDNVQLAEPPPITVFQLSLTPPSCENLCNGTGSPIAIGGVPGYSFNWSNGESSQFATMLCEGTTTLSIVDNNGCSFDSTFTLVREPIVFNLITIDILCNGTATGTAEVNPEGGAGGPYTVTWSNGDSGNSTTDLVAGSYTVTITDVANCPSDSTFLISEEPPIELILDLIEDESCPGSADGSISISVNGGTPNYSYAWTGPDGYTSGSEDISGLLAGDYSVTVTDANLCEATGSFTVDAPPAIDLSVIIDAIPCAGLSTGAIDLTVQGGTPGYTYNWTGPNSFSASSQDISGLEAGTYSVTVTDLNLCSVSADYDVSEPQAILVSESITNPLCAGSATGVINTEVSGGSPNYSFAWTGPNGFSSSQEDIANLEAGTYTLTVTDSNSCFIELTFELNDPDPLQISFDGTPISCAGAADASIDLSVSGGTPDYTYSWTGPGGFTSVQEDLSNLGPGTYQVTVTDNLGCEVNGELILNDPLPISIVALVEDVSCGGLNDGAIEISVLGGSPGYVFSWTGPSGFSSGQEDLIDLFAGTYELTVTDIAGCSETQSFEVSEVAPIEVVITVTDIDCNGAGNGSIELEITGGQSPFQVNWSGPDSYSSTQEDIFNLEAGDYSFSLTDDNNCPFNGSATVIEAEPIEVVVDAVNPQCDGFSNGSIELLITGGQEPYQVDWDNGDSGPVLNDLPAGTYIATITDGLNCSLNLDPIVLSAPPALDVSLNITGVLCNGEANGAIDISISGGTPDYQISWTGPNGFSSIDQDLVSLEEGSYDYIITDDAGCTIQGTADVTAPASIEVPGILSDLLCSEDLGDINISPVGGQGGYIYEWSGPNGFTAATEDLSGVAQGTYSVIVRDVNDCIGQASFELFAPDPLVVSAVVTPLDCSGQNNGSIEIELSGGQAAYFISWTGPDSFSSTDEDLFDLSEGAYILSVEDQNGCLLDTSFQLTQPPLIDLSATIISPLCAQQNTGAIDVELSGGFPPYTYTWTGPDGFGSPAQDITNLNPGDYTLHVEDQGSCVRDTTFTLDETPGIILDAVVINIACGNESNGSIELNISGGTPDYTTLWDGPNGFVSTDQSIFNLEPGTYSVEINDANLCAVDTSFTISEPNPLELIFTVSQPICSESNGSIEVVASGGQVALDYTYSWFDVSDGNPVLIGNDALIENLTSGLYEVEVTDDNGCVISDLVPLTDQPLNAEFDFEELLCNGDADASIDLTILDGTEPYVISWSGPDGFSSSQEDISGLTAGEYILSVVDSNGCVINEVIDILEPEPLVLDPETTDIFCNGGADGAIETQVFGGTEPYQYSWVGPEGFNSTDQNLSGLNPGDYTLTLTDNNSCVADSTVSIIETTIIEIELDITEVICFGASNGSVDLIVNGGTAPYQFSWMGPGGFSSANEDLINLVPGEYTLNLTDVNNCSTDSTITIQEAGELIADVLSTQPSCGAMNGAFEASASGGVVAVDYQYIWYDITDGNSTVIGTSATVSDLPAGIYFLEVFDDLGCSFSETLNLSDADGLIEPNITDVLCFGDSNGTIAVDVTGATEPLVYSWMGPNGFSSADQNISDLEAGTYTLVVDDALGCTYSDIFEVGSPDPLSFEFVITDILCAGDSNGQISVVVTGGTAPFALSWEGDGGFTSSEADIADLAAGCYTLSVIDNQLCEADSTLCLLEPSPISEDALVADILCGGTPTGSIDLSVTGGSPGYVYNWVGPNGFTAGSEDINLVSAGSYDLQITDEAGCTLETSYFIDENPALITDPAVQMPLCPGQENGIIDLNPAGGVAPLTIEWTGPDGFSELGPSIGNLSNGVYTWLLTDNIGCFISGEIELIDPDSLNVQALALGISCFGEDDGSIELELSGGTPDYTVFWTGPNGFTAIAEDIFNLEPGSYQYQAGDSNACTLTGVLQIEEPQELVLDLNNQLNPNCSDSFDGLIDLEVSGGQPEYLFSWTGPEGFENFSEDATELGPGIYGVTVTDQGGCVESLDELELFALATVTAQTVPDTIVCEGTGPWTFTGTSSGGVLTGWEDELGISLSITDTLIVEPDPGSYFYVYQASDAPCFATDTLFLTVLPSPLANAGEDQLIFPEEQVEIGGSPTSSSENTVTWFPSFLLNDSTLTNPTVINLVQDQWFTVTVTDLNGCQNTDSVRVGIIPEIVIPSGFSPNGDNTNELWIIENVGLYPSIEVEIYNRWGDLLYRNVGYTQPWDGRYEGEPVPIGTYYYVIDINEPEFEDEITGPLTILR